MQEKQFTGLVNGQEFTDVESYLAAATAALNEGQPVNLSYTYEEACTQGDCDCKKCGCECKKQKLAEDELAYLCPRYVYGTLGGDLERNEEELLKIRADLDQRFDEFEAWYGNNTCNCEVERIANRILKVADELEIATEDMRSTNTKLLGEQTQLRSQIEELTKKLTQVEAEIAVLDQERRIIEEVATYYEDVQDMMENTDKEKQEAVKVAPSATLTEKNPQKEYTLRQLFSNEDNVLDNILANVQPSLNENDKAEIKKYANDLVSQFNRLLRCF